MNEVLPLAKSRPAALVTICLLTALAGCSSNDSAQPSVDGPEADQTAITERMCSAFIEHTKAVDANDVDAAWQTLSDSAADALDLQTLGVNTEPYYLAALNWLLFIDTDRTLEAYSSEEMDEVVGKFNEFAKADDAETTAEYTVQALTVSATALCGPEVLE